MSNKSLLLHIGLQKTGSRTLQRALFFNHPQVHYLGKVEVNNSIKRGCVDDKTYRLLKSILWDLEKPMNTESTLSLLNETLLPLISEDQVLVGSWESLASQGIKHHHEMLNRTQSIFGGCRIMITLRNPIFQIPSLYLQNLQGNFLGRQKIRMRYRSNIDIETWYKMRLAEKNSSLLNYSDCIRKSIEQLGRENVGVFLFEELKENPKAYYQSICKFMGIDSDIGASLTQDEHFNIRLSEMQVTYMHEIHSSFFKRGLNALLSRKSRRKGFSARAGGSSAKAVLPDHLIKEVSNASREGHRWLVEKLDLPLEKYGYPL
ncbi:MAG: sulfotransferase domain-containing protein [Lentisphaeria bacterium]|nr:sulfotransferase domain-containing protein [Lentisphaeria bacterium]NQZ66450.1 sulfotransferase domain-containing protein [Lentisphaeria bacterium]